MGLQAAPADSVPGVQLKSRARFDPNIRLVFDEQQFQCVRNKRAAQIFFILNLPLASALGAVRIDAAIVK